METSAPNIQVGKSPEKRHVTGDITTCHAAPGTDPSKAEVGKLFL
jgi:hypothetical protein